MYNGVLNQEDYNYITCDIGTNNDFGTYCANKLHKYKNGMNLKIYEHIDNMNGITVQNLNISFVLEAKWI